MARKGITSTGFIVRLLGGIILGISLPFIITNPSSIIGRILFAVGGLLLTIGGIIK